MKNLFADSAQDVYSGTLTPRSKAQAPCGKAAQAPCGEAQAPCGKAAQAPCGKAAQAPCGKAQAPCSKAQALCDKAQAGVPSQPERFDTLLSGPNGLVVERIVSHGHTTITPDSTDSDNPVADWYDQELDEWVVVLEGAARLAYEDGREVALAAGDTLFIPRHVRHRVSYTSSPCIWLAIHGELTEHS